MNLWHEVDPGTAESLNVVIEIPKGSANKYEIDKETGLIALDRALESAQHYPFDYGFVPKTLWDDGDALDVVVLTTHALYPGVIARIRPVGAFKMNDDGESDDKVFGVPEGDPRWDGVRKIEDVNPHTIKEIKHFFETYKMVKGKKVTIEGVVSKNDIPGMFNRSRDLYNKKFLS